MGGSFALQGLALLIPGLRSLLGIGTLGLNDLVVVGGTATLPLLINDFIKKLRKAESHEEEFHIHLGVGDRGTPGQSRRRHLRLDS